VRGSVRPDRRAAASRATRRSSSAARGQNPVVDTTWNIADPSVRADPWPRYRTLLDADSPFEAPLGIFLVARYEDCLTVLRHPAASSDYRKSPRWKSPPDTSGEELVPSFLFLDPPDHTRLRGLVSRAFTAQRVEQLRPRMQEIVDRALARAAERGGMEVVSELALPLPVLIICELLGVPPEDEDRFRGWSSAAVRGLDPWFVLSPDEIDGIRQARREQLAYFRALVELRSSEPRDDLISALLAVARNGGELSEHELVVTLALLLTAGHETTVNLIANGVLAFARHPEQFARLRAEPALLRSAVEEVLRFAPPVHLDGRLPLEQIRLSGGTLPAFADVTLVLAAANRDPRQFDNPDEFDIGRANNRHLGFGFGLHHCVGASLARLEGQVALGALARRFSALELVREPPYKTNLTIPGVSSLEIELCC
jgi:cytochrome P450